MAILVQAAAETLFQNRLKFLEVSTARIAFCDSISVNCWRALGHNLLRSNAKMDWFEALYAAVDDDAAFTLIPDTIAAACGTRSAMISVVGATPDLSIQSMNYWSPEDFERYFSEYQGVDPWGAVAGHRLHSGQPISLDGLLPPEEMMRSTMFNELMRPLGDDTARCLGLGADGPFGYLLLAVHRAAGEDPFQRSDEQAIAQVHRHMRTVLRLRDLHLQARLERSHWQAMVEASGVAMLLLSTELDIRAASTSAIRLLDRADGLSLFRGRLVLEHRQASATLHQAVTAASRNQSFGTTVVLCPRRSGAPSVRVEVLPAGLAAAEAAIVILVDPQVRSDDHIAGLAQAYRFTPAETELARGLLAGETSAEVAARRGTSIGTVRSQLKSVLSKTNTNRQVDLIRLLS